MFGALGFELREGQAMSLGVYYRVSTDGQSIDHQRRAVWDWIGRQGYANLEIIEYLDEGLSGALGAAGRPGFAALLDAIRGRRVTRCLMFEPSRASRDFMAFLKFLELCSESACVVEVVGTGTQAFETSTDKLMAAVQGFVAQAEREKIAERTRSGLANARAHGVKLGAPKGHRRNLGRRKKYPEALVAEVRRYTAKGLSCRDIAEILGARFTKRPIAHTTVYALQKRLGLRS